MEIYVDADACPVKDIINEVGDAFGIPVHFILSLSHYSPILGKAQVVVVDNTPQEVDMAIINRAKSGDIVITQDYGLAAVLIGKGCIVLHHTGKKFTSDNIDSLLLKRHLAGKVRRGGGKTKGPKAFTNQDRENFREALTKVVENFKQE